MGMLGHGRQIPPISTQLEHFRLVTREHKLAGKQIPKEMAVRKRYLEALTEPFIKDTELRNAVAEFGVGNFDQQVVKLRKRAMELAGGNEARARAILQRIHDHAMQIKKVKLESEISFPVKQAFSVVTGLIEKALRGKWG